MAEKQSRSVSGVDDQRRLDDLLRSNRIIRFIQNLPDKEFPFVTCSIYGAPKTNELFVKLSNGQLSFVGSVPSRLEQPPMEDRIFGMDALDQQDALMLAEMMWEKYRNQLIDSGGTK